VRDLLRKLRGVLGIGLTWGGTWAVIFALTAAIIGIFDPDSIDPGEGPLNVARIGAIFGFISGTAFGLLLALGERHKKILQLSMGRAALLGALSATLVPLLTPVSNSMVIFVCPIAAAIASGSVAIARKAERRALTD
jgi:hypothetical protein